MRPCGENVFLNLVLERRLVSWKRSLADICSFSPSVGPSLCTLQIIWMFAMNLGRFLFLLAAQIALCFLLIAVPNPPICVFFGLGIHIMLLGRGDFRIGGYSDGL